MDTEEKRYVIYRTEWDDYEEEYVMSDDDLLWDDGQPLEFDTYAEFLAFMSSLTKEEKRDLGDWRLENRETDEYISIRDGEFDDVNFLQLHAERTEK